MQKHKKVLTLLSLALVMAMLFTVFAPAAAAPKEKVRVWVEFAPGKKANVEQTLKGNGAEFHHTFDDLNSYVVTMPTSALNGLMNNPHVVGIEEDTKRYPMAVDAVELGAAIADVVNPGEQTVPWGVTAVQAPQAWSTTTGQGIKVCIIDSGYYQDHSDLPDGMSGYSQVDNAWDEDGLGHGSHVAGTIAAENDSDGVVGVAYGVELFIVKIFDNNGAWTTASDLAAAANTCADNGANIISMSLGGGYNRREERSFGTLYSNGVLSIAAASNDGVSAYSYPASYASVVSVGALDESLTWADFSNFNDAVEVSAPGVDVLSTVPYVETRTLTVDGTDYSAQHVEYSAYTTATGQVVDGGLCTSTGAWSGKVVMCERGDISFYDKVMNVQNSGGVAAVIYNNEAGDLFATLGEDDSSSSAIVALGITQADGQAIVANDIGTTATVGASYTWPTSGYESYQGTSMATPHASAVAALVWSACPSATNVEVRDAMNATAMDLGTAGKDDYYGYGMVQAADAIAYLCGGTPVNNPPTVSITSPSNGATYTEGDTVSFSGSASDVEDGNISASISWTSSIDGSFGSGASASATLSVGTHTITASVTDSDGASDSDSITVTVESTTPTNTPPTVSIDSPSNGATYTEGDTVSFSGSATDAEDGDISGSISWTSSIDGSIGTGASASATLSVGTHTITASVTDSEGASDSDSITVTVEPASSGGDLTVVVSTDKSSYINRERVYVTTTVTDGGSAVAGAAVTTTITLPNGGTATYSGTTGTAGTYTFSYRINSRKTGTGTATVASTASMSGYTDGNGSTTFTIQ